MATAYRELPPPRGLEAHVACLWTSHDRAGRILPDGCVDIVFTGGRLLVAGPATTAVESAATPGRPRAGVRFRVASAGVALGVPASELRDRDVALADLWGRAGRRLEARVAAADTPDAALAALTIGVAARLPTAADGDPLVRAAAMALARGASVTAAGGLVALGERQLRRRFEHAVGYGPATFVRVQRFQRFLALAARRPDLPLGRLAADVGYADQSHLVRECRSLAGTAPGALLAGGVTPAGDKSVSSKPGGVASAMVRPWSTSMPPRASSRPTRA